MKYKIRPLRSRLYVRFFWRLCLAALFVTSIAPSLHAQTTNIFTSNVTIASDDTNYDGQIIVIDGCTVTVNGSHPFSSVTVSNAGVLTHQPTTAAQEYSLALTLTGNLLVDATSSINVTGCGYLAGYTLGNTITNAASYTAGGSYGGLGGLCCSSTDNPVYGDYHNPNELGSGSGTYASGASGGGLVRITAAAAHIDGTILANGANGYDGGSGGGLYLNVGTLSGTGQISANGGNSLGGNDGGGGGRVAIYYDRSTFNLSENVTANGGSGPSMSGSLGTVYLQQTGSAGQLVINNHGTPVAQWTPLGVATNEEFEADTLLISGTNVVVAPQHQMPVFAGSITVTSGGELSDRPTTTNQEYSLIVTITNSLLVDGTSSINVTANGYLPGYTLGNTTDGAATFTAGGSYGGLGGSCCGSTDNAIYGDFHYPDELGSGSGTYATGAPGGGLVQITAGAAQVDGTILADGGNAYDGGSGGGILLNVGTLSGAGSINANGGNSIGGNDGGGGGRVAVYYGTSTFNLSNNVTAYGGVTDDGVSLSGSAGTVYLQQTGNPGQLVINNDGSASGQLTLLGEPTDATFTADTLVLSGAGTVAATISGAPIQAGSLSLVNGAVLTHLATTTNQEYSLVLTVTNELLVDASSSINVSGLGYQEGYTLGNTTNGAAYFTAGGSYGGLGGLCCNSTDNAVYGDYHYPNELGSGSGTYSYGGIGGGLAHITAASAHVDGAILANGLGGNPLAYDGGSGGGILLNVGTLAGTGQISANGGDASGNGGGGGGRVAIYYNTANFNFSSNVTAYGGTNEYYASFAGSAGTVYLKQAGNPGELVINNNGTPTAQWTPLGVATNQAFGADALIISGTNTVVVPQHQMPIFAGSISITNGGELSDQPTTTNTEYSLLLTITNNLLIDALSSINVSGTGYLQGYTLGNTTNGAASFTAGGSYGGLGGLCCGSTDNALYGDYHFPNELGSGSGTYGNLGTGGGLVQITAGSAQVDGAIMADGLGGTPTSYDGGSGGGILLNVGTLSGTGQINANGGLADGNDGGGGGRVAIYTWTSMLFPSGDVLANGGSGPSSNGQNGTVYISSQPYLTFLNVSQIWHGEEQITWSSIGIDPNVGAIADVVVSKGGVTYFQQTAPSSGGISWNTASVPDGSYTLTVSLLTATGQQLNQVSQIELINNTAAWHEGTLFASQTWGSNTVNAVDQNIIIPSGVTLTIEPGAIIKFANGVGIIIQPGGTLDASGATVDAPIIFTSLEDSTVGGDTDEDGNNAVPLVGDWNGITVSGQFLVNSSVQVRYVIQAHNGTLGASQEWFGAAEHLVTGNVIVPAGVTLTIDPGAIVKFNLGLNITVQSGGTLIANGTVAQPIVFTSINDESVGTVTNGALTTPAAGDWDSIYLSGGNATFNHVTISYGGGPDSLNSGLISLTAAGSALTISDSILSQGFYKGIQTEFGTANITNCLITGCDRGIQVGLTGPTVVNVINCTLDNNNYGIFPHGGVLNVANTIVADSLTAGVEFCCGSALATFEYCDIWSATGVNYIGVTDQTGVHGNISADPDFVNPAQGNYELNYSSPCINTGDGKVAPLTDLTGAPCYNYPDKVGKAGIPNAKGVIPDMGAYEFVQNATSDVDLIVSSVTGPVSETAGQTVIVQWNDENIGTGNAIGPWRDTVSLVGPGGTNLAATAVVAQNVVLGPGQIYAASASVVVPSGVNGNYQWQIHVNSQGDVFEGVNWTNNVTSSASTTTLTDPTLAVGGRAVTNFFTAAGQSNVFALTSTGGPFVLTAQGSTPGCALVLYVGDGYVPSPSAFDQQSSQFNSPLASVTVPGLLNHTYYVVVYARSLDAPSVSFTLSATSVSFALNSVSPSSIADAGAVTLEILGEQLAANDSFALVGPGGTFAGSAAQSPDSTVTYATFNLNGAAVGAYNLSVTQPGGASLTLTNAVTVTSPSSAGIAASLIIQLQVPPAYRSQRPFDGTIVYRNAGEVDMPAPLLILTSGGVAGLALQGNTNFLPDDLLLMGVSFQGPAGTLAPGQSWSIPFTALTSSQAIIPFAVNYELATATNLIAYRTLESSFRPKGYSQADWNLIWTNFQAQAGPTWGGFVTLMDFYANEMEQENAPGTFYLVQDVLSFAFADLLQKATANAFGTLYLTETNNPLPDVDLAFTGTDGVTNGSSTTTSFDGTFALGGLVPGTYSVTAPGYWLPAPILVTIPASGVLSGLSIIVSQGGGISGTVSNADYSGYNAIAQGATPYLTNVLVQAIGQGGEEVATYTDQYGNYSFTGLTPDTYTVSAGGSPSETVYDVGLSVNAGQTITNVNFALGSESSISGAVASGGAAVTDATITLTSLASGTNTTVTDSNGDFSLNSLAAGRYNLEVQAPGFAPSVSTVTLIAGTNFNAGTISLNTGATLTVTVQTGGGAPVTNGFVTLLQDGAGVNSGALTPAGQVVLTSVLPGNYTLDIEAVGYLEKDVPYIATYSPIQTATVTLLTGGIIQGTVTDGNNATISNIEVSLYGTNGEDVLFDEVDTQANGTYIMTNLPLGTYTVSVGNNNGLLRKTATISAAQLQQTVNFQLSGGIVTGMIVAANGVTPATNATVSMMQGTNLLVTAITDLTGAYRIRGVASGTYTLQAGGAGGITSPTNVTVSGNTVVTAPSLSFGSLYVAGEVTGASENLITNAVIELTPYPAANLSLFCVTATGVNGVFSVNGLSPGQYAMTIYASGFALFRSNLTVSVPSESVFVMNRGVSVAGTITSAGNGQGITQVLLAFVGSATHLVMGATLTDSNGDYSLPNLQPGAYDLVICEPDTDQLLEKDLSITDPTTFNATLAAQNTSLGGTVTDSNGNPLPGAEVDLSDSQGVPLWTLITDSSGAWVTGQLPPGNYSVKVSLLGFFPVVYPTVIVAAGAPVQQSTPLIAAGTDDFSATYQGLSQIPSILSPGKFYNYLKQHDPTPVADPRVDIPLPGYNYDCPEAKAAYDRALQDQKFAYDLFLSWQQTYNNYNSVLVSGPVIFGLDVANLAGSIAALVAAPKVAAPYQALSTSGKVAFNAITVAGPFAANIYNTAANWAANTGNLSSASADDVMGSVTSLLTQLGSAGASGYSFAQIKDALIATPGYLKFGNPVLAALSVFFDAYSNLQAFLNQANTVTDAQANYNNMVQRYLQDRAAIGLANINCPPPTNTPPPPPNPTPGPTNPVTNARSADPNDKLATGFGKPEWVGPSNAITYTVQFANEANASAAAQTVAISDPLAANLDWSTLQLTTIAFNNVVIEIPTGVQTFSTNVNVSTDPNPVSVTASLDAATGVVSWLMESINPVTGLLVTDPLAGFLPPDNKKLQGEGYVVYTIFPKSGLATGVTITNKASIVFDLNAPILTPITTNTIDVTAPTSSVLALPTTTSSVGIPVKWSGQDLGSGIAGFNIFVSTDGGPWTPWLLGTSKTSAVFNGTDFTNYAFYSVAYDQVGNVESAPGQAQALTTVNEPGFPSITKQPTNEVVISGKAATFSVVAKGTAPLKYQWMKGGIVLTNKLGKISGATTAKLVISSVGYNDTGSYSVTVSNKLGGLVSSNATLEVVPGITIVSPAVNAVVTNGTVIVKGTAIDDVQVLWQLNGGPFQPATGTSNWSASVTLRGGTNVFAAMSVAGNGGESALATRSFILDVYQPITLLTNGYGGITGIRNGQELLIGKRYVATAVPRHDNLFSNWTGSITSTSNPFAFYMQSNMVLQANFVTNQFLTVAGVYNGLFYPAGGVTEASSGFITATIDGTSTGGTYSAKLLLDGGSHSFSGSFDLTGTAQTNLVRAGKSPVSVTLKLNFNPAEAQMNGMVSNTEAGWNSLIQADRAVFGASLKPATNLAGRFTLSLAPDSSALQGISDGYAAMTNTLAGVSTFGGALADGTPFLWSVPISKDGNIPFYQSLYSGRGSLLGWITITNQPPQNIFGQVNWIKPATPSSILYPAGFTNTIVPSILGPR